MKNQDTKLVKEFYEKIAEGCDERYETPYWKLYDEITWANVKKFVPKRRNAIIMDDGGGGTGYWAITLAKYGYRIVLTDISENMLKVAREKIKAQNLQERIEMKITDVKDMSCFSSDHFDMALAEGDPVSYCLNAEKAISELARVVRPNAHVIVSVDSKYPRISGPIEENSFRELSRFLRTSILKREFKSQTFTPEELRMLFEACGVKAIRKMGKPILIQLIPRENRDEIIGHNSGKLLELELEFRDTASLVGMGGHLEIVGVKKI